MPYVRACHATPCAHLQPASLPYPPQASAISTLWDSSAQQSSASRIVMKGNAFEITSQGSADPLTRAQSMRV